MLIPNLSLYLAQEVSFLYCYSIIHLIYVFESKVGQPNFITAKVKKVIALICFSRDGFTLILSNCVYSMSFISFVSNISYILTPVNSYILGMYRISGYYPAIRSIFNYPVSGYPVSGNCNYPPG